MTMITKKVACGLQKVTKEDGRTVLEPVFVEVECPEDMHRITGEIEHCKTVVPKVEATTGSPNTGSPTANKVSTPKDKVTTPKDKVTTDSKEMTTDSKEVVCVETGEVFSSIRQASKSSNVDFSAIAKCCKGKRKTAGGCHWRYVDVTE